MIRRFLALAAWRRPRRITPLSAETFLRSYPAHCQKREDGTVETPGEAFRRTLAAMQQQHNQA